MGGPDRRLVTVDLTEYYTTPLCPGCSQDLERPDEPCHCSTPENHDPMYAQYRAAAQKYFGDRSLPICRHCFFRHAEWREEEEDEKDDLWTIPIHLDDTNQFEYQLMLQTTLLPPTTSGTDP